MKICPFKIYNTACRLQVIGIIKSIYAVYDSYIVNYGQCIEEENCPIANKNWRNENENPSSDTRT